MITENVKSNIHCTLQCFEMSSCVGGFYQPLNKICVHCRSKTFAEGKEMEGSLFYGLVESTPVTKIIPTSTVSADIPDIEIELRITELDNTVDYISGFLEVFLNNQWKRVCHSGWNWKTTTVACKQLGVPFVYGGTYHKQWYKMYTSNDSFDGDVIKFENLNCTGSEGTLKECASNISTSSCEQMHEMALTCFNYNFSVQGLNVALGSVPTSWDNNTERGLLWVKINGIWGNICANNDWKDHQTDVPCRSLNQNWRGGYFDLDPDEGNLIHATMVECTGGEQHLFNCPNEGWKKRYGCTDIVEIKCGPE